MRIHVLALDGVFDTGLSSLLDTFNVANDLAALAGAPATHFDVTIISVTGRNIRTSLGFTVPAAIASASHSGRPDVVLVPALGAKIPETLRLALARSDAQDAAGILRELSSNGAMVGAACTGTFVLGESLLLNGQAATTSWWLAPLFRERYPHVKLEESRMVIGSSNFVTAGAALAHVDLALWLVRRSSPALAALVARYLLVDSRSSQAIFAISDHLAHADPLVERFERWARGRLNRGFSLSEAAKAAGTSERTLSRRLRAVLGKSPLSYFQDLRVEQAIHLLRTSNESLEQIAAQVGYAEGTTLRSLLRRKIGRTVGELRKPCP